MRDRSQWAGLAFTVLLTGVASGLAGAILLLLLQEVQHLSYGYSLDHLIAAESFLNGVHQAPPERRVWVMICCGLVAGIGWWMLFRFGRGLVSIKASIADPRMRMPTGTTLIHGFLQIVTVGMGSPLGREVAPREYGVMMAGSLARRFNLSSKDAGIVIACGAGAGLSAVYNASLGGALFAMETLLRTFRPRVAVCTFLASSVATLLAWSIIGDRLAYHVPDLKVHPSLVMWAALCGPFFGWTGGRFAAMTRNGRARALTDWRMIPACLGVFTIFGILAIPFPDILGNGKGPIQLGLEGDIPVTLAIVLIVLKLGATFLALRAGAEGGLLTPGITVGSLIAVVLGSAWNAVTGYGVQAGSFALVGGAAFLAVSMKMPLTAVVLAMEFTGVGQEFMVPLLIAVGGATATGYLADSGGIPVAREQP